MLRNGPTKTKAWIATTVLAVSSITAFMPAADAATEQHGPPEQVIDRARHGEDAIRALGDRLPEVAARNDKTSGEFKADLREDDTLWVGPTGQLLFVDDVAPAPSSPDPAIDSTDTPGPAEIFTLHSRPGAQRVIHLDFDGHDYTGTAWGDGVAAAYSTDGDPSTFTASERAAIHSVWQRVAEDYAPFAVDVTTEDPGYAAINRSSTSDQVFGTRVVITPTKAYNCSCGGVAYVGVYDTTGSTHDYYQPAWVFTTGVGNGAKNIAEAASHEAGHNLGLSHDGTSSSGYYSGQGSWAPIMGVGYYKAITQWSRGEYSGANETQDDYAVIVANGAPLDGDTDGGALPLGGQVSGIISTPGDVDAFSLTITETTEVALVAEANIVSPNLDIELRLKDGSTTIGLDDPSSSASTNPDGATGLGASLTVTLDPGTYTVEVDGVGFGSASSTGYSDYGSTGRYRLSATSTGTPPPPPANDPPTATASATTTAESLDVDFTGAGTDTDGTIVGWSWSFGDGATSAAQNPSHTYTAAGTYSVTLTVTDDGGATGSDTISVTVTEPAPPPPADPPATPDFTDLAAGSGTVTISWTESTGTAVNYELQREFQHKNGSWRGTTTFQDASSPYVDSPGSGTFQYRIRALGADGQSSAWSAWSDPVAVSDAGGGGGGGGGGGKGKPPKSDRTIRF